MTAPPDRTRGLIIAALAEDQLQLARDLDVDNGLLEHDPEWHEALGVQADNILSIVQAAIAAAEARGREQGYADGVKAASGIRALWLLFDTQGQLESVCSEPLDDHEPYIRRSAILALIPAPPADGGDNG